MTLAEHACSAKILALVLFVPFAACGQTLTVCEVLRSLDHLNGREVRVRGVWQLGHTGRFLWSDVNCEFPVIRDGWAWKPLIQLWPQSRHARAFDDQYQRKRDQKRSTAPPSKILATITGRLETRSHFRVSNGHPVDFKYAPAIIRYRIVEQIEKVPYTPGELERALEAGRHPYPTRAKK